MRGLIVLGALALVACGKAPPPELADQVEAAVRHRENADGLWRQYAAQDDAFAAVVEDIKARGYHVELDRYEKHIERIYSYTDRELVYER